MFGWTSSTSTQGNCLPPVLCAKVENSFQASGGADDGGFIRSAYTGVVGVTAVGGTASGVWESPAFTYDGAGGKAAGSVSFSLDRRSSVDQLLAVAGNSAEYTVRLVDLSAGGATRTLIAPTTLAGANSWTEVSRNSIDPQALNVGDSYRIQITSSYTTGTAVVSGAGKRLLVRVSCPRKVGRTCRTTAQGLLSKHRPATLKQTVRLRPGKGKLVALRVKPAARKKISLRKRLLVRQKVQAGKTTATVYEKRKLIRR